MSGSRQSRATTKVPHATIEGRDIYVVGGRNTQTVNVCSKANERGVYQSKLRLPSDKAITQEKLVEYRSLRELMESLLSLGANVEDFTNWSAEWKKLRKRRDPDAVLKFWQGLKPTRWQRGSWSGELEQYRHERDENVGEKEIERALFRPSLRILRSDGKSCLPVQSIYHQLPLANQRGGQVISDAFATVEHLKGKRRPVMIEVKVTDRDCWYALVECLQQVHMGRSYGDFSSLSSHGPISRGVWGLVLAPSRYFEECRMPGKGAKSGTMSQCVSLLKLLKGHTQARIAFASSDRLQNEGIIVLEPEENWFGDRL